MCVPNRISQGDKYSGSVLRLNAFKRVGFFCSQALGFAKFSLLGWSDGGITALIAAAKNPDKIKKMVVWGSNAFVSQQDLQLYNGSPSQLPVHSCEIQPTVWMVLLERLPLYHCSSPGRLQVERENEAAHGGDVWSRGLC